ncbi:MAG: O-antigen ligase family protein [Pleurocapsa sp.]
MTNTNNLLRIFEKVFAVIALFHTSQALLPLVLSGGASEGDGVSPHDIDFSLAAKFSLLIYAIVLILLFLRWKRVFFIVAENKFIWMLMGVACFSYFWSVAPGDTFRFSIYALGTTAIGLYLATRFTLREQLDILSWSYALMVILSILFVIALPKYGLMGGVHEGALRGVFTHKNQFGAIIVPGVVIFLLKALRNERNSWIYWLFLGTTITLLVLARSTTALGTTAIMLLLYLIYRIFRWRYEIMVSVILAVVVAGLVGLLWFNAYVDSDSIFQAFGKDSTLSSRTLIWDLVWDKIQERPLFGYGLSAFWNDLNGPSSYIILAMGVTVAYAHNGFLDLCLALGFVGLSIFLAAYFSAVIKSLAWLRYSKTPEGLWPLLFLSYLLLSNMSEGTIHTMDNGFWAIFTAISYSLVIARNNKYTNWV